MSYSNSGFPQSIDLLGVKLQSIAEEVNLIKENGIYAYSCLCYHMKNVPVFIMFTLIHQEIKNTLQVRILSQVAL